MRYPVKEQMAFPLSCPSALITLTPSTDEMDALLLHCFLHALKSKVKKSELPLLTSSFLRNHMFPCWYGERRPILNTRRTRYLLLILFVCICCSPSGKQLDIKKSSYKKVHPMFRNDSSHAVVIQTTVYDTRTCVCVCVCMFVLQLSKFLQTMQQQHGVVRVKELTKGVESLVEVDWKNTV